MLRWGLLFTTAAMVCLIASCQPANTYVEPPPPEVTVATPLQKAVTSYAHYTGTTQAVARVEVRARVKGFLKKRLFEEGTIVKEGQLLMVIDEEPFQVQLEQAQARQAEAEAVLKKAEESRAREVARSQCALDQAQLVLSQIDEARNHSLFIRKAASREDLDKAEATRKKNEAQLEADRANLKQVEAGYETSILSARANIKAAMAAVRAAAIDLGYCRITAPIEGRITKAEVDAGNFVGDGQATLLATIHKTNPIYVYMYVSEDDVLRVRRARSSDGARGLLRTPIKLEMGLASEAGFPHEGQANYWDPGLDPGTGTLRTRGVFDNPTGQIMPGLFVRVRGQIETRPNALTVPENSLGHDQAGDFLLVVGKDNLVERRKVQVGDPVEESNGARAREVLDQWRVVEGEIGPDDLVIVGGLQRARSGLPVRPKRTESKPQVALKPRAQETTASATRHDNADTPPSR